MRLLALALVPLLLGCGGGHGVESLPAAAFASTHTGTVRWVRRRMRPRPPRTVRVWPFARQVLRPMLVQAGLLTLLLGANRVAPPLLLLVSLPLLRALLTRSARASDLVCRIGGEEFCVLFEDTGLDTASARLRGILAAWSAFPITLRDVAVEGLAFSAGVALFPDDGTDPDELLRRADARMYDAKRAGRARVFVADA